MTKHETVQTIKALGMTAKWSSEWEEFTVNYKLGDNRRTGESSYHTTDSDDAIETARVMSEWRG